MVLTVLRPILLVGGFGFFTFLEFQGESSQVVFIVPALCVVWFITVLAETNRAPFDFAEGESELVSGFNVEYGAGGFALLFLAEYGRILVISVFSSFFFFGCLERSFISFFLGGLISFFFLWVRGRFPRLRYDQLIGVTWKRFLPVSLFFLFFSFFLSWGF